jgi:hypothetical protein
MKTLKENFSEIFTIMAWLTLFGYIWYCTANQNKDGERDAWNIMLLIAGFVWGSQHKKNSEQKTTTEITPEGTKVTTETPPAAESK